MDEAVEEDLVCSIVEMFQKSGCSVVDAMATLERVRVTIFIAWMAEAMESGKIRLWIDALKKGD